MKLLIVLLIMVSSQAFAISEVGYSEYFSRFVMPDLKSQFALNSFRSFDGKKIFYGTLVVPASKGTIVISPGRTESIVGFSEMIYDLSRLGYSVAIIDHRGQGYSERLVTSSDVGHVEKFEDYVEDFSRFLDQGVVEKMPQPYFLLADSMGAAISTLYLLRNPRMFSSAVFAAPMFRVMTNPFPESVAKIIAYTLWAFGRGLEYAPTRSSYNFNCKFEENTFTHSEARFSTDLALTKARPSLAVGGPSVNWIREVMKVTPTIRMNAKNVTTPILIFSAGSDDYVRGDAQRDFCKQAPFCQFVEYPDAAHSILIERDSIRDDELSRLDRFFVETLAN